MSFVGVGYRDGNESTAETNRKRNGASPDGIAFILKVGASAVSLSPVIDSVAHRRNSRKAGHCPGGVTLARRSMLVNYSLQPPCVLITAVSPLTVGLLRQCTLVWEFKFYNWPSDQKTSYQPLHYDVDFSKLLWWTLDWLLIMRYIQKMTRSLCISL